MNLWRFKMLYRVAERPYRGRRRVSQLEMIAGFFAAWRTLFRRS